MFQRKNLGYSGYLTKRAKDGGTAVTMTEYKWFSFTFCGTVRNILLRCELVDFVGGT